jgi:hypothetical protein
LRRVKNDFEAISRGNKALETPIYLRADQTYLFTRETKAKKLKVKVSSAELGSAYYKSENSMDL